MQSGTKPLLSITSAHLLSGLFAFIYVGSIYASKNARLRFSKRKVNLPEGQARLKLQNERWRDDPDVIKARLLAVTSATLICCLIVFIVTKNFNRNNEIVGHQVSSMGNICLTTVMCKTAQPYRKCVALPWVHMVKLTSAPDNSIVVLWTTLCPVPRKDTTIPKGLGF
jgi:hypothetical protein